MKHTKVQRVILCQVKNNPDKIDFLIKLATKCFLEKKKTTIITPDEKSSLYIDNLLWTTPKSSFLPHALSPSPLSSLVISSVPILNDSKVCINLTQNPIITDLYSDIYEFEEVFDKTRMQILKEKLHKYKSAQFSIAAF